MFVTYRIMLRSAFFSSLCILLCLSISDSAIAESPLSENAIARKIYLVSAGDFATFLEIVKQYDEDRNELYATDKLNELRASILKMDPFFYSFKPKETRHGLLVLHVNSCRHYLESTAITHALRAVEVQAMHGKEKAKPYWADVDKDTEWLFGQYQLIRSDHPDITK